MKRAGLYLLWFAMLAACMQNDSRLSSKIETATPTKIVIALKPFGKIDTILLQILQSNISNSFHCPVVISEDAPHPSAAWHRIRQRYIADSLLTFLMKQHLAAGSRILGITNKDISTTKNNTNWGIMGLGYCPGAACVISTYRVSPSSANRAQFNNRMVKLALHELGHNFGAPHCPVTNCIMKDAEGKMHLDREVSYCLGCRNRIMAKM